MLRRQKVGCLMDGIDKFPIPYRCLGTVVTLSNYALKTNLLTRKGTSGIYAVSEDQVMVFGSLSG